MKRIDIVLQPNKIISVLNVITDKFCNLDKIKAREFWKETNQGLGTVVAVIDSGIEIQHPSLKDNIIGGYNFTDDDNGDPEEYNDYNGHGTHVSGIIAAKDIKEGIVGVAPKAKLLVLKTVDSNGTGSVDNLTKAIKYATNWIGPTGEKVSVINISLGTSIDSEELRKAVKNARLKGIVLVAAAGNEGDGKKETVEMSYPGFYEEVIQVGSVSKKNTPSRFSNTNVNIDFVAPGENIVSTHLNGSFVELTGTSMAAPFVSGAAALIIKIINNVKPEIIPFLVYNYLWLHAKKLEGFSFNEIGNGFISLK
jgi:major intracellular serine protease